MTAPSTTLAAFRIAVAIELRDGLILTATGDGSETTFEDEINLTDSLDAYRASHGIVVSAVNAANVGKLVRVENSSPQTHVLQFQAGLPAITKTGDVLHLVNLAGQGFRPQMYDQAIRNAIEDAYPDAVVEATASGEAAFAAAAATVAVPAQLQAVYALEALEDEENDEWRTVPQSRNPGRWGNGWSPDKPNRVLRIDGLWRDEIDGFGYRLRGYGAHALPTANGDPITIDRQWLTTEVKGRLAARRGTDRQWQQWAVEWGRQADERRVRILTPLEPSTVFFD